MKISPSLTQLLLAIYLILVGLSGAFGLNLGIVPAILALVVGILMIIGR
ncbi:MAG: hypothetical protein QE570_08990 [Verrucomicrobiota bacterium]|jgi:hypothetical protein|nr:hypothetical protein [Verrucomicrobiota bacterium]